MKKQKILVLTLVLYAFFSPITATHKKKRHPKRLSIYQEQALTLCVSTSRNPEKIVAELDSLGLDEVAKIVPSLRRNLTNKKLPRLQRHRAKYELIVRVLNNNRYADYMDDFKRGLPINSLVQAAASLVLRDAITNIFTRTTRQDLLFKALAALLGIISDAVSFFPDKVDFLWFLETTFLDHFKRLTDKNFRRKLLKSGIFKDRLSPELKIKITREIIMQTVDCEKKTVRRAMGTMCISRFEPLYLLALERIPHLVSKAQEKAMKRAIIRLSTQLWQTILQRNWELSEDLIARGADINYQDREGNTIFHHFASSRTISPKDKEEILENLIKKYGADPTIPNDNNQTPIELAAAVDQPTFEMFYSWLAEQEKHTSCATKN